MLDAPDIASIAALMGDSTRAAIITALMDGQAHTATELALEGGVTPSTASSHLARLTEGGLLEIVKQGRHRYYRIASPDVSSAIEGLMSIAPKRAGRPVRGGNRDEALRRARVCYDHLAGEMGVRLLDRLRAERYISGSDESVSLTNEGEAWCEHVGVDLVRLRDHRRRLCRECLDWSQRRMHLAGALGAALLERMFELRLARRERGSRAVTLSSRGERFVEYLDVTR